MGKAGGLDSSSTKTGADPWNEEDDESTKVVAGTELWKVVEEEWILVGAGCSSKVGDESWNVPELWKSVDGTLADPEGNEPLELWKFVDDDEAGKVCGWDGILAGPDENEVEDEDDPEEPAAATKNLKCRKYKNGLRQNENSINR